MRLQVDRPLQTAVLSPCCRSGRGPAEGGPGEAGAGQHGGHPAQDGVVQRSVDTRHLPCVVPYPLLSTQGPTRGINKRETSRWTLCTLFRRCLSHLRTYWWDIRTFTRDNNYPSNTGSNPQTPFTKAEAVTRSYDTVSKRSGAGDNVHTLETFAAAHFR